MAAVQLARLYRKNHQVREAEAVEAHLRTLLAVADPDYPTAEGAERDENRMQGRSSDLPRLRAV
jgi:hypothetical protein